MVRYVPIIAIILTLAFNALLPTSLYARNTKKPVYAAYILDDMTGRVFHKTNENTRTYPASLTKVMTLYMLFDALKTRRVTLNTKMTVSKHASRQKPSKLWLKPGSTIKVKDAVMALTVKSANDVAVVVAEHLGGTEKKFAALMTKKARALGARNTVYQTASGLPNRQEITTAKDQTIIFRALHRHFPSYWRYFKHKSFTFNGQKHPTHSRILTMCPGVDGLKTGFINASGFNLVVSAKRQNARLFAVVMGGETSRWRDKRMTNLINRYFPIAIELNKTNKRTVTPPAKPAKSTRETLIFAKNLMPPHKPQQALHPLLTVQSDTYKEAPLTGEPDELFQSALEQKTVNAQTTGTPKNSDFENIGDLIAAHTPSTDSQPTELITDDHDADTTFTDDLPSDSDADILSNIIANESYDDLDNLSQTDTRWVAQFGAYASETDAQERLNFIMDIIPDLPGDADVSEATNRRTPLYRARLVNLSKEQSEVICKKMRLHDISCLPLKD